MKKYILIMVLSLTILGVSAHFSLAQDPLGLEYGKGSGLGQKDLRQTVAQIIKAVIGLIGIIMLVIMVSGGFLWMTSFGDEKKVETAKSMIIASVIGLGIVLTAYAITTFVTSQLVEATK